MIRSIDVSIRVGPEPDAWAKLYGDRQSEPLTELEQAILDIARDKNGPDPLS